jgi:hypothetical protein
VACAALCLVLLLCGPEASAQVTSNNTHHAFVNHTPTVEASITSGSFYIAFRKIEDSSLLWFSCSKSGGVVTKSPGNPGYEYGAFGGTGSWNYELYSDRTYPSTSTGATPNGYNNCSVDGYEWHWDYNATSNATDLTFSWHVTTSPLPPRTVSFELELTVVPNPVPSKTHNHEVLFKIDGVTKATFNTSGSAQAVVQDVNNISAGPFETPGAFSYAWLVDGVTVASGTYAAVDEIPGNVVESTAMVTESATPPPQPPDPDDPQQPGTVATTDSGGTTTTTTTDADGNTTTTVTTDLPTGSVADENMTKQDFYDAVRQAVVDAMKETKSNDSFTPPAGDDDDELASVDTDDRGHVDDVQGKLEEAQGNINDAKSGVQGTLDGLQAYVDGIPTEFGTASQIDLGTYNFLGHSFHFVVSLTSGPVGAVVGSLRAAMRFVLSVGWIAICVRTLKDYL